MFVNHDHDPALVQPAHSPRYCIVNPTWNGSLDTRQSKLQLGGKVLNLNLVSTDLDLLTIDGLVLHGLPGGYSAADVVKLDKRKRGQADLLLHFDVL